MILQESPEKLLDLAEFLTYYHKATLKTWIGGARLNPQSWENPMNWYPNGVPSWADKVVIGGYGNHKCTISQTVEDITGLKILPNAKLHILSKGKLCIDGQLADQGGIIKDDGLFNEGMFINNGQLTIKNSNSNGVQNNGIIVNEGTIFTDHLISNELITWGRLIDRGQRFLMNK